MSRLGPALSRFLDRLAREELAAEQARAIAQARTDRIMREARYSLEDERRWRVRITIARVALHHAFSAHHHALKRHTVLACALYRLREEARRCAVLN